MLFKLMAGIVCISASIVSFVRFSVSRNAVENSGNIAVFGALLLILGIYLVASCARPSKHQRQQMQQFASAIQNRAATAPSSSDSVSSKVTPEPEPQLKHISFKVAGTTYNNDDGKSRQTILRHMKFQDAPYVDEDGSVTINIKETEYDGELAYQVYMNDYLIGYVPKSKIEDVHDAMQHDDVQVAGVRITGGGNMEDGEKINYGCMISLSFTE